jgi:hypothetical protein
VGIGGPPGKPDASSGPVGGYGERERPPCFYPGGQPGPRKGSGDMGSGEGSTQRFGGSEQVRLHRGRPPPSSSGSRNRWSAASRTGGRSNPPGDETRRKGVFRAYVNRPGVEACPSLRIGGDAIPSSPSGLLSAAALGVDVEALLCGDPGVALLPAGVLVQANKPALRLAALHRYHERQGRPMAYSSLTPADWSGLRSGMPSFGGETSARGAGDHPHPGSGGHRPALPGALYVTDRTTSLPPPARGRRGGSLLPQVVDEPLRG